jgi:hypothetical protein
MGIHFQMEEPEQDICLVTFQAPWTWAEFDAMVDTLNERIAAIPHPVATIVDMADVGRLPGGNILMHLRRTEMLMPQNVDMSVMVNASYAVTTFMSILMRVRPRVKDMTREARAVIAEYRQQQEQVTK